MEDFKRKVEEAATFIRPYLEGEPGIGLVLGTGLGGIVEALDRSAALAYETIPHYPVSTVQSHRGRLVLGRWAGKPLIVMQGRIHLYEGYSPLEVSFPVRVLRALGVRVLILSNAAGGLNPSFQPGDLMLVSDHINLTGCNPLAGPNLDEWGPRFPDMTEPYSRSLQELALATALSEGIRLHRGVYVGVTGPSLETAAETRFLRAAGADAVGMSLIAEAITAVHAGMQTLAISAISNVNLPDCYEPAPIEQIIATAGRAGVVLTLLLEKIVEKIEAGP
jgi:purine-nucleoside phosphorylase